MTVVEYIAPIVTPLSETISSVPAERIYIEYSLIGFEDRSGWSLIDWILNLEIYK